MPKLFGNKNPEINDELAIKIFSFFDSQTLAVNAQFVNKDWLKIVTNDQLKDAKELCKNRVIIHNRIFRHCSALQHETPDSMQLTRLNGGWTNMTFIAENSSHRYVVRLAGTNTDVLIDRKSEAYNARLASACGVNTGIVYTDAKTGSQVTEFINKPISMKPEDFKEMDNIKRIIKPLKMIHQSDKKFLNTTDVFARINSVQKLLLKRGVKLSDDYFVAAKKTQSLQTLFASLNIKKVPCHNDTTTSNFIFSENQREVMHLIDWEYSGNNDPIWDLAFFSLEAGLSAQAETFMLANYFEAHDYSLENLRFKLYKPIVEYWAGLWTHLQISNKNHIAGLDILIHFERERMQNCIQLFKQPDYETTLQKLTEYVENESCLKRLCLVS